MMMLRRYARLFAFVLFGSMTSTCLAEVATLPQVQPQKKVSIYERIGYHLLPSFASFSNVSEKKDDGKKKKKIDKSKLNISPLSEVEQKNVLFDHLKDYESIGNKLNTSVITEDVWKELEIFSGPSMKRDMNLLSAVDRTQTKAGQAVLGRMLVQPQTDVNLLRERQGFIGSLIKDENLFTSIDSNLHGIKNNEAAFYSFFYENAPVYSLIEKGDLFGSKLDSLNTNKFAVGLKQRMVMLGLPLGVGITALAYAYLIDNGFYNILRKITLLNLDSDDVTISDDVILQYCLKLSPKLKEIKHDTGYWKYLKTTRGGVPSLLIQKISKNPSYVSRFTKATSKKLNEIRKEQPKAFWTMAGVMGIGSGVFGFVLYKYIKAVVWQSQKNKAIQQQLIEFANVLRNIEAIYKETKQTSDSVYINNILQPIETLLIKKRHVEKDVRSMLSLLAQRTFKGKSLHVLPSYGSIFKAMTLLRELRGHLIPALEAVGEIDSYMSVAKLCKEFENKPVKYSLVDFVEDAEKPSINFENFWFPALLHHQSVENIVPNSVEMHEGDNGARNIILTGPNTGGKSTILKGIITSLLMAQSFGVAPATKVVMTPFAKIQSYMNIADNSAEGESLFRAELKRASSLMETINNLGEKEFSFTLFDEIFNGTSAQEAIMGTGFIADNLLKNSNSMCLIATHFRSLTGLEKMTDGAFKNYKVNVIKHDDGSLTFPYTLHKGVSDQKIAMDLIKQDAMFNTGNSELAQKLEQLINEEGIR